MYYVDILRYGGRPIDVFMDNFLVVGDSFECCLNHLAKVLKRCEDCNLVTKLGEMSLHVERGYCIGSSHHREGYSRLIEPKLK